MTEPDGSVRRLLVDELEHSVIIPHHTAAGWHASAYINGRQVAETLIHSTLAEAIEQLASRRVSIRPTRSK